jgi:ppGpp synthetase/RelA/SpoT-type nucleotidyltranferase
MRSKVPTLDKVFSRPFIPALEAEIAKGLTILLAQGKLTTDEGSDRWLAIADAIRSHPAFIFFGLDDLVGARIVVHNLADLRMIRPLLAQRMKGCHNTSIKAMLRTHGSKTGKMGLSLHEQDYIARPKKDGYRAVHLNFWWARPLNGRELALPCELQIRTQAQHLWALLSRDLLYKNATAEPSDQLKARAIELADLLQVVDKLAEGIAEQHAKERT